MAEREQCMDHSAHETRIKILEKNQDDELFPRLRDLERAVWQSAARTGLITGAVVLVGQAIIQHYWK